MVLRRTVFALAILFMLSGPTRVQAEAENSLDALMAELKGVTPSKDQHLGDMHFVVTNEERHDLYEPILQNLGGAYLGVGTNQNFEMIGWSRPKVVIMMDFDQMIVDMHHIYREAFLHAETPKEFIALWSEKNNEELLSLIKRAHPDLKDQSRIIHARNYAGKRVYRILRVTRRRYKKLGVKSYLDDQGQYDYLRSLYQKGHVIPLRVDLTGKTALRTIGDILKKHKIPVKVAYISNCEQYFEYTEDFRTNMRRLPIEDDSLVLRARVWREYLPGTKTPKGKQHYTFIYQPIKNFLVWLEQSRITDVKKMIRFPRINDRPVHFKRLPRKR